MSGRAAPLDVGRYLARIGVDADTGPPTFELLAALQLAHLVSVPFENLDVYHGRGVRTDLDWSYHKVVERRRGGWCFELNGCFAALLDALGFEVDLVSCNVWLDGRWGPDFDHLALVVRLHGDRWLVDVGFGDNCLHPLLLVPGEVEARPRRARLEVTHEGFTLIERRNEGSEEHWEPQARGTFEQQVLERFDARSRALQTEPGQLFTAKPFATRALDHLGGRVTLLTSVLRVRDTVGSVVDTDVAAADWSALLADHFGIVDVLERSPSA